MDKTFFAGVSIEQVELSTGVRIGPKDRRSDQLRRNKSKRRCQLRAEGEDIGTLEVEKTATKARTINYRTYTVKDGHLLKTLIQAQWQFGIARFRGGASYALGDHPIAEDLRALGMGETAVVRLYAPQVQSMLHPASVKRGTIWVRRQGDNS